VSDDLILSIFFKLNNTSSLSAGRNTHIYSCYFRTQHDNGAQNVCMGLRLWLFARIQGKSFHDKTGKKADLSNISHCA
jgi:hypothetical protein